MFLFQTIVRKIKSQVGKKHISSKVAARQREVSFSLMSERLGEEKILSRVVQQKKPASKKNPTPVKDALNHQDLQTPK